MNTTRTLRATSPDDILALVPRMLGFHPESSLCLIGLGAPGFHARVDLPPSAADHALLEEIAGGLTQAVGRQGTTRAVLVAYTADAELGRAALTLLHERLSGRSVSVALILRADGQRWFCVESDGDDCEHGCDPSGTPYDVSSHRFTADGVVDGEVVYPSRAALRATLTGEEDPADRGAIEAAADRALTRLRRSARHPLGPPTPDRLAAIFVGEVEWIRDRISRALDDGQWLEAEDAGRLLAGLTEVSIRDVAWCALSRSEARRAVDLWRDLVRRAPERLVAPPAGVLAFAAWLAGDGALAWCAIDRCQQVDPDNTLAALVAAALAGAVPPSTWEALAG